MKLVSASSLKDSDITGDLMLLYGEPGVGKSVTSIQTCTLPCCYIMTEPRDPKKFIIASGREEAWEQTTFALYESWYDALEFLASGNFSTYNTIILDSVTHLMLLLLSEITSASWEGRDEKKKNVAKEITLEVKSSQEDYGALSKQMERFTNSLARLSQQGKTVICLARLESNPKYNRALSAAPALSGREYSKNFPGYFDFIGLVRPRMNEDGRTVYPPSVTFEQDESQSFLAKWNGIIPKGGVTNKVLHVEKILDVSHGKGKK